MKISELILELEEIKEKEGDCICMIELGKTWDGEFFLESISHDGGDFLLIVPSIMGAL